MGQNEPSYAPQPQPQAAAKAQPYLPRDAQPFPPRDQQVHNRPQHQPQPYQQPTQGGHEGGQEVGGLPAFITGGGGQPQQNPGQNQNGHDQGDRGRIVSAGIDVVVIAAVVASALTAPILLAVNFAGRGAPTGQDEGGGDEPRQPTDRNQCELGRSDVGSGAR